MTQAKAKTLRARIVAYHGEWLVSVDDARVPPTNNLAEQALRPPVVTSKLTFGKRARDGGERMATLMTISNTTHRHGHRISAIFLAIMTHAPTRPHLPNRTHPTAPTQRSAAEVVCPCLTALAILDKASSARFGRIRSHLLAIPADCTP